MEASKGGGDFLPCGALTIFAFDAIASDPNICIPHRYVHHGQPRAPLISIGFTSGLSSIGYSVLSLGEKSSELTDSDLLNGTRNHGVSGAKRLYTHMLIVGTVLERFPPAVIAVGPPVSRNEPEEWVMLMRAGIFAAGYALKIPVLVFENDYALVRAMGATGNGRGNGIKFMIEKTLARPFRSNERRLLLATATAAAAYRHIESESP